MNLKWVSILGFLIGIAAIIGLAVVHALFGESVFPILVQILAVALMVWARATYGWRSFHAVGNPTKGGLVMTGPYRYVRHPIYASVIYFTWAGVLSHLSVLTFGLGLLAIGGAAMRIVTEEKLVAERYPEYAAYANRTARVIPFFV